MPGPITHQIFYKQLKEKISKDALLSLPNYDKYSIFAQGHDLLIYYDFYKIFSQERLDENVNLSNRLQEYSFTEFIYCCLKKAQSLDVLDNEQFRLFIGPGYIAHHILDAYIHPFIIYHTGDHIREKNKPTWLHGIAENLIDIFMMEQTGILNYKAYPVHRDFLFKSKQLDKPLYKILEHSLDEVYDVKNGAGMFFKACKQMSTFMRILKYDRTGIKRIIYDFMDPILKGTSSFSYHRDDFKVIDFLNNEHNIWYNPMDKSISSNESFLDLYNKALVETAQIINNLEILCQSKNVTREKVFSIVPNIASTHGLMCGKSIDIKYTKTQIKY